MGLIQVIRAFWSRSKYEPVPESDGEREAMAEYHAQMSRLKKAVQARDRVADSVSRVRDIIEGTS